MVSAPSFPPLQLTSVCKRTPADGPLVLPTFTFICSVHPLASVTTTVYEPAPKFTAAAPLLLIGDHA